jgi:hypothetical protein
MRHNPPPRSRRRTPGLLIAHDHLLSRGVRLPIVATSSLSEISALRVREGVVHPPVTHS